MSKVYLMFGFDTERPYGEYANTSEGLRELQENLVYIKKLGDLFEEHRVKRTFFILGDFLYKCNLNYSESEIQEVLCSTSKLVDIQQHTYSHSLVLPLKLFPDRPIIKPKELQSEIIKTTDLIHEIFGKEAIGLRIPIGYPKGIKEKKLIIESLIKSNIKFVSSDLRDENESPYAPLKTEDTIRQPYWLDSSLLEIPSHSWQDNIFININRYFKTPALQSLIVEEYTELMRQALNIARIYSSEIFLGLCLHPWALKKFDPKLQIIRKILSFADDNEIQPMSYESAFKKIFQQRPEKT